MWQHYVPALDRIVLGNNQSKRSFVNVSETRKTAITTRVMQLIHTILGKGIHITKRDLFYTDVKLFVQQTDSDGVLDDVATMAGCTRSNLNVVASDKGLVVGRVQFEEDGDEIDCTKVRRRGGRWRRRATEHAKAAGSATPNSSRAAQNASRAAQNASQAAQSAHERFKTRY